MKSQDSSIAEFMQALQGSAAALGHWPDTLRALWHAERGEWERAHEIAQDIHSPEGSWIHANLHREEGDDGNAGYWYRRAGRPASRASFHDERMAIARALCGEASGG